MSLLKDKVAVVTGSGSGIGQGIALEYAKYGAKVMVSDINEKGMEETLGLIKDVGGEAASMNADVRKTEDTKALIDGTAEKFGRLDILVNNAGVGIPNILEFTQDSQWRQVMDVNLDGVFRCTRHAITQMKKNKDAGGAIVNISSIEGLMGTQMLSAYSATKHAVIGLTKASALELAQYKIRVNAICPGAIDTPMMAMAKNNPQMKARLERLTPLARFGTPQDVARAAVFLASELAEFITGTYVIVDGGMTAGMYDALN